MITKHLFDYPQLGMEHTEGKYLYCVMRKPASFDLDLHGVGGGEVHCVDSQKLTAVVSDAGVKDYPITRENTITHQRVIEAVMQAHAPVLPVSFGTVAENASVIQVKMLSVREHDLLAALDTIAGKVEVNLKAMWLDMPKIFHKIVSENPELTRVKDALSGKALGRDEAIGVGKLVAAAVESRRGKIKEAILSRLDGILVESKETPLLGEQMIFNLAFLIPENKQQAFDTMVRNLDTEYADENVYFKYVGPIPPFNFVTVPISLA